MTLVTLVRKGGECCVCHVCHKGISGKHPENRPPALKCEQKGRRTEEENKKPKPGAGDSVYLWFLLLRARFQRRGGGRLRQ